MHMHLHHVYCREWSSHPLHVPRKHVDTHPYATGSVTGSARDRLRSYVHENRGQIATGSGQVATAMLSMLATVARCTW